MNQKNNVVHMKDYFKQPNNILTSLAPDAVYSVNAQNIQNVLRYSGYKKVEVYSLNNNLVFFLRMSFFYYYYLKFMLFVKRLPTVEEYTVDVVRKISSIKINKVYVYRDRASTKEVNKIISEMTNKS